MAKNNIEELKELLEDNEDLLLGVTKEINSYDGCFDFVQTYDLEELCEIYNAGNNVIELVRSIIYGNVGNINYEVRYDGDGNLETVYPNDLEKDCLDNLSDIVDWIMENGISDIYSLRGYKNEFMDDYNEDDE